MSNIPPSANAASSSSQLSLNPMSDIPVPASANAASSSSRSATDYPAPPKRLPTALWQDDVGLVVSPNMNIIPVMTRDVSQGRIPPSTVPVLADNEIYMAFRPRFAHNTGDLFGRLNLTRGAIAHNIVRLNNGKYIICQAIAESWGRLENALLDVITILLAFEGIPSITYPKFPWECGYRDPHDTLDKTLSCVIRSRNAFMDLTSVVTFALALYLDDQNSLDAAWERLMAKSKVHAAWLDLLATSYVCNFNEHFRVGGVINPYLSYWASRIPQFVSAHVPIWILWGHYSPDVRPLDRAIYEFLPPKDVIEGAQKRAQVAASQILPIIRYEPFANTEGHLSLVGDDPMGSDQPFWDYAASFSSVDSSQPSTFVPPAQSPAPSARFDSPPPPPSPPHSSYPSTNPADVEKRALDALNDWFADVEKRREAYLKFETPVERVCRIDREKHAATQKYSKKSTVYVWRGNGDGHYIREKVNAKQVDDEWFNFTRNQRRFTGHKNEWDLCPQLPRYSKEHPKPAAHPSEDDSDYESDSSFDLPVEKPRTTIQLRKDSLNRNLDAITTADLREPARSNNALEGEESDEDRLNASHTEQVALVTFLRERFGYDIFSPANWNRHVMPSSEVERLTVNVALRALSFEHAPGGPGVEEAVIQLVKTLSNTSSSFTTLPASFDHSPANPARLSLKSDTLEIKVVTTCTPALYLVHKRGPLDNSPWSIATYDASTVLLIFRMNWPTVEIIARELVQRGVPFNTVAAVESAPVAVVTRARGLGSRAQGYTPTPEDYLEYLRIREDLLKGPQGRAALLRGGIIGRIARDVLEPSVVLDGPSPSASVVARFGRFVLVDDQLTNNDMDIICGVYYVRTSKGGAKSKESRSEQDTSAQCSWWPQDSLWRTSNCFLRTQWTELAEKYYQDHLSALRKATRPLKNAGKWKQAMRRYNKITKIIYMGTEHYQTTYLQEYGC